MIDKTARRAISALTFILFAGWSGWACQVWAQTPDEDHKPVIHGIATGMTAQEVLDHVGGRMPDARKEEKGSVILTWKIEDGNILLVTFRGENISELRLFYKKPRPTTDLWLAPLASPATSTALTAADPRLRRDYKATETEDKLRTVWTRREKTGGGYEVEISFLSSSRRQFGERFEENVEYKYVTVPKDELKKFDDVVRSSPKKQSRQNEQHSWQASADIKANRQAQAAHLFPFRVHGPRESQPRSLIKAASVSPRTDADKIVTFCPRNCSVHWRGNRRRRAHCY